jgi:hexosaminidase
MKFFYCVILVLCVSATFAQKSIHIIPQPVDVQEQSGWFTLSKTSTIGFNKPEAQATAEMLTQKLNTPTGFLLKTQANKTAAIQLNINDNPDTKIGKEGYTLAVTPKGVEITANATAGLYYGVLTLMQLLPKEIESKTAATTMSWTIPAVKITDYPRFGWRGLMLDVSRHFFSKNDVKKYIDQMSKYKYNTLHWHLTDDNGWRLEIKSLPKLTEIGAWRVPRTGHYGDRPEPKDGEKATYGGFYTQDEVREIIKYAAERNVTIVPEVDVPGHSMAIGCVS